MKLLTGLGAFASIILLTFMPFARAAEPFSIAPPSDWVIPSGVDSRGTVVSNQVAGGERLLLLDEQVNAASQEYYVHFVSEIVNENGVQDGSQISLRFDPSYQQLTIHHVRLVRGGQVLDRLDRDKIKLLQQERDLDRHIYDGSLSAVLFLEDVRAGDQVDYAYMYRGVNPILRGRYVDSFSVQSSLPVARRQFRLLWPNNRSLSVRNRSTSVQPVVRSLGGEKEYLWVIQNSPPVLVEDYLPSSFDAFGWVQLSEFPSWAAVARWAADLYPPARLTPEISTKIGEWKSNSSRLEEQMLAALQFVQDDVRYLGFEIGPNSHRPTEPATVFERRFGDCKDKAYLLCTVLRQLGIECDPALVNTGYRSAIADWLPSPYAFNHVVARVRINGREFWVDPTRSQQRGPLSARYFPDYGRALIVRANTTALTVIPPATTASPKTTVEEFYAVHGRKEAAELRIVTTAEGLDAERLRSYFSDRSREEVAKNYLNFYARHFPQIQSDGPLEFFDMPASNVVQMVEHYRIEAFWSLTENKRLYTADLYPLTLSEVLDKPSTTLRSMPLAVAHPRRQVVRTEVSLPEEWTITGETNAYSTPAGKLSSRRAYQDRVLSMEFDYQSFTNVVFPSDVPEYLKAIGRMDKELSYQLTWQNEELSVTGFQPNWSILLLAGLYSIVLLLGGLWLYRWRPSGPPAIPQLDSLTPAERAPEGLGGWLILIALGLVVSPFKVAALIVQSSPAYALNTWHSLTMPASEAYHSLWAPLLIFELLANLTTVVLACLLLLLFFKKRITFPRLYIGFLLFSALVGVVDELGGSLIPAVAQSPENRNDAKELLRSILGCCIWIPYMLVSRRVRATFVR